MTDTTTNKETIRRELTRDEFLSLDLGANISAKAVNSEDYGPGDQEHNKGIFSRIAWGGVTLLDETGVGITFGWEATASGDYNDSYEWDVHFHRDGLYTGDNEVKLHNVEVVDEDGDSIDKDDLAEIALEIDSQYNWEDAVENILEKPKVETLPMDDNTVGDFEVFRFQRDADCDLQFRGMRIAHVMSNPDRSSHYYSGCYAACSEIGIYKTDTGKFVAVRIVRDLHMGAPHSYTAEVCDDLSGVAAFFADPERTDYLPNADEPLSRELYEVAERAGVKMPVAA